MFPTYNYICISLGMHVSAHTYISGLGLEHAHSNLLQVTMICVSQGNTFPLKYALLHAISILIAA